MALPLTLIYNWEAILHSPIAKFSREHIKSKVSETNKTPHQRLGSEGKNVYLNSKCLYAHIVILLFMISYILNNYLVKEHN